MFTTITITVETLKDKNKEDVTILATACSDEVGIRIHPEDNFSIRSPDGQSLSVSALLEKDGWVINTESIPSSEGTWSPAWKVLSVPTSDGAKVKVDAPKGSYIP